MNLRVIGRLAKGAAPSRETSLRNSSAGIPVDSAATRTSCFRSGASSQMPMSPSAGHKAPSAISRSGGQSAVRQAIRSVSRSRGNFSKRSRKSATSVFTCWRHVSRPSRKRLSRALLCLQELISSDWNTVSHTRTSVPMPARVNPE